MQGQLAPNHMKGYHVIDYRISHMTLFTIRSLLRSFMSCNPIITSYATFAPTSSYQIWSLKAGCRRDEDGNTEKLRY